MSCAAEETPRTYVIKRHDQLSYGFVAGNEMPTIVKFVTPDGPSYKKLLPNDIILVINGINVENKPREQIFKMIQLSDEIDITVRQPSQAPPRSTSQTSNTLRPIKISKKHIDIMQKTFKVFTEDGQYRSFELKEDITVGKVLETLNSRLDNSPYAEQVKKYFGLALTAESNSKEVKTKPKSRASLNILDDGLLIRGIKDLPYAHHLRIYYRMVYPPSDVEKLYYQNRIAFEYLYRQSCNDLCHERFYPDLDTPTELKLSALHLLEHINSMYAKSLDDCTENMKLYLKRVEDDEELGLKHFVPSSMISSTIDKKGRKIRSQYKKLRMKLIEAMRENLESYRANSPDLSSNSFLVKQVPVGDNIKLMFLKHLAQLPCYTNPVERSSVSVGDCSSSMESVPKSSDSSPLLTQYKSTDSSPLLNQYKSSESSPLLIQYKPSDSSPLLNQFKSPESSQLLTQQYKPSDSSSLLTQYNRPRVPRPPPPMCFTRMLTDRDIENLKVPPPPSPTSSTETFFQRCSSSRYSSRNACCH